MALIHKSCKFFDFVFDTYPQKNRGFFWSGVELNANTWITLCS